MADAHLTLLVLKSMHVEPMRDFYKSLGIEFDKEQHGTGPEHYAGKIGDCVLEIYPLAAENTAAGAVRLGFSVDSVADALSSLENAGAKIVEKLRQTGWGARAVVRDPDGRTVELYQRQS